MSQDADRFPLPHGYYARLMAEREFFPLFGPLYDKTFSTDHTFFGDDYYTPEEKAKLKALSGRFGSLFRLHIGLFSPDDSFVGFSFGYQETADTFYMICSAVDEQHRRKGLYQAAVELVVKLASAEGFQIIYGTHCATNNAVIIPKLKAGFVIGKMELSDTFGTIIHLHYYTNPLRRKVMDYRSGLMIPDAEIRAKMKLDILP